MMILFSELVVLLGDTGSSVTSIRSFSEIGEIGHPKVNDCKNLI